jgi:hypothetical protein
MNIMKNNMVFALLTVIILFPASLWAQAESGSNPGENLVIVWTSDDPYVAERMVLMYAHASKTSGWFDEVTIIIWGPSAKMVAENSKIREKLEHMQKDGVEIRACIVCANMYEVTEELKALNFDVQGMGKPLTEYLKSGAHVLTF